jgi:hypothetical protein
MASSLTLGNLTTDTVEVKYQANVVRAPPEPEKKPSHPLSDFLDEGVIAINSLDDSSPFCLANAVKRNNVELVERLLAIKASPNGMMKYPDDRTTLSYAVDHNFIEVTKRLLDAGANVHELSKNSVHRCTPEPLLTLLIEHGAQISPLEFGDRLLTCYRKASDTSTGVSVNGFLGDIFASYDSNMIVRLFEEFPDTNVTEELFLKVKHEACLLEVVKHVKNFTGLMFEHLTKYPRCLCLVLREQKDDLPAITTDILHEAMIHSEEMFHLLLSRFDGDIDTILRSGITLLQAIMKRCCFHFVELVIAKGAKPGLLMITPPLNLYFTDSWSRVVLELYEKGWFRETSITYAGYSPIAQLLLQPFSYDRAKVFELFLEAGMTLDMQVEGLPFTSFLSTFGNTSWFSYLNKKHNQEIKPLYDNYEKTFGLRYNESANKTLLSLFFTGIASVALMVWIKRR